MEALAINIARGLVLGLSVAAVAWAADDAPNPSEASSDDDAWRTKPGMYAVFHTNHGELVCVLFPEKAPETIANFVGLAEGTKAWTHPRTGEEKEGARFYDGLIFHRVIPNFMIQGGCPLGTGTGGPGYKFGDEFHDSLKFDRPGRLAMANAGPGTNGSQFFITEVPTEWLNNKHSIFGQLIAGDDVVRKMARLPQSRSNKPNEDVLLERLEIVRVEG